jgi:hypothetical protein
MRGRTRLKPATTLRSRSRPPGFQPGVGAGAIQLAYLEVQQKIKIPAGKFSTSAARQVFQLLLRSADRFGNFIARHPNLWPGIQVSGTIDLQGAKQMPFIR